jgi:hypothetical protein
MPPSRRRAARWTPGGRSSTTCASTAPCRSPDLLVVFKAARRQEYLQQNLRILSAPRGETVETTYGLRWQAAGIRGRPPEPGEEALLVFTSQPYRRFTPARFARVVATEADDALLRMRLELGSRARVSDAAAVDRFLLAGPNPSEQSQVWIFRTDDEAGGSSTAAGARPPVEYADAGDDEHSWRETIERLAPDADYRAAVFLRIAAVRPAENGGPPVEPPYRLRVERPYLVQVASHNPHLDAEAIAAARLVPLYDELATAVVIDHAAGLPRDGAIDVLVAPIVGGPGWLELNVSLGVDLVPAASLGWVAEGQPSEVAEEPAAAEASAPPPLRLEPSDPLAEAAVRALAVAVDSGMEPGQRVRLLRQLRTIAPGESRLAEAEALALYDLGRFEDARAILGDVPLDTLGAEGRATLLSAILRTTGLPEPLERVRMADLSRPESFRLVLAASRSLPPAEQVRLSEFVVGRLLADDRAAAWLSEVMSRELPPEARAQMARLAADLESDEEGTR